MCLRIPSNPLMNGRWSAVMSLDASASKLRTSFLSNSAGMSVANVSGTPVENGTWTVLLDRGGSVMMHRCQEPQTLPSSWDVPLIIPETKVWLRPFQRDVRMCLVGSTDAGLHFPNLLPCNQFSPPDSRELTRTVPTRNFEEGMFLWLCDTRTFVIRLKTTVTFVSRDALDECILSWARSISSTLLTCALRLENLMEISSTEFKERRLRAHRRPFRN